MDSWRADQVGWSVSWRGAGEQADSLDDRVVLRIWRRRVSLSLVSAVLAELMGRWESSCGVKFARKLRAMENLMVDQKGVMGMGRSQGRDWACGELATLGVE